MFPHQKCGQRPILGKKCASSCMQYQYPSRHSNRPCKSQNINNRTLLSQIINNYYAVYKKVLILILLKEVQRFASTLTVGVPFYIQLQYLFQQLSNCTVIVAIVSMYHNSNIITRLVAVVMQQYSAEKKRENSSSSSKNPPAIVLHHLVVSSGKHPIIVMPLITFVMTRRMKSGFTLPHQLFNIQ